MGQWTYLGTELIWALPIVALQWIVAGHILRANLRVLIAAILLPTLYLCSADALAIRVGIWTLNPERTLDIWIGALPLEEGVFFLLTNTMVVQGILALDQGKDGVAALWRRGPTPSTAPEP